MQTREGAHFDPFPILNRTLHSLEEKSSPQNSQRYLKWTLTLPMLALILMTNSYGVFYHRFHGYQSSSTLFGVPVVSIGNSPRGLIAFGGDARGFVAVGGCSIGVIAIGGFSIGIVAIGGGAIGLFSFGGLSIGLICAIGGGAFGLYSFGGGAFGGHAYGGVAGGYYTAMGHEREFLMFHE
jgi:hypothetical protein